MIVNKDEQQIIIVDTHEHDKRTIQDVVADHAAIDLDREHLAYYRTNSPLIYYRWQLAYSYGSAQQECLERAENE